jgi:hypothetical protein
MRNFILAALSCAALLVGGAASAQNSGKAGVNSGTLSCTVAGGIGFVFGSSKALNCVFSRLDGTAERYTGTVKKFGVDVGFTNAPIGGGNKQVTLQPISIEGSVGLNVAAGLAGIELKKG